MPYIAACKVEQKKGQLYVITFAVKFALYAKDARNASTIKTNEPVFKRKKREACQTKCLPPKATRWGNRNETTVVKKLFAFKIEALSKLNHRDETDQLEPIIACKANICSPPPLLRAF